VGLMDFVEELSAGRIEAVSFGGQPSDCLRSAACTELAVATTSFGKLTSFDLLRIKGTQYSAQIFQHQRTITFRLSFTWARALVFQIQNWTRGWIRWIDNGLQRDPRGSAKSVSIRVLIQREIRSSWTGKRLMAARV